MDRNFIKKLVTVFHLKPFKRTLTLRRFFYIFLLFYPNFAINISLTGCPCLSCFGMQTTFLQTTRAVLFISVNIRSLNLITASFFERLFSKMPFNLKSLPQDRIINELQRILLISLGVKRHRGAPVFSQAAIKTHCLILLS